MKTQNKKLLAIMAVSAIMTCPVWAADTTVGTTGVTTSGTTGLTGYESAEELAAIQRGEQPITLHSTQAEPTATEATSTTATASTTTASSGATGYEPAEEPQATDQAVAAPVAAPAEPERQAAPVPADVVESGSIPYVGGLGDVQVDTSIPGYPIAAVSQDEEAALPYSHALTDDQAQAVAGKVVTTVTIGPLPEPALAQKFLPRLAMRSGDAIEANYVRHDLNVLGSSGLFASVKPVFTPVPEGVALNYEVEMNPVLKGIEFTGNDSIKSEDLEKMLHIQPGTVLNSTIVSKVSYISVSAKAMWNASILRATRRRKIALFAVNFVLNRAMYLIVIWPAAVLNEFTIRVTLKTSMSVSSRVKRMLTTLLWKLTWPNKRPVPLRSVPAILSPTAW